MMRGFALLLMLLLTIPAMAAEPAANDASADTNKLTEALAKLSASGGFSSSFRQIIYFAEGGEQHYTGTLAIKRPGHFRWQYTTPYEQLYVSSGDIIWHYEADLMQAERMRGMDIVDPVAMKLLDGRIGAKDIKLLATEKLRFEGRSYHIRIGDGPELVLAFSVANDLLWLESVDMLGNRNRMIFSEVSHRVPPESTFQFVPPEGVDVIDATGYQQGDANDESPEIFKIQ